MLRKLSKNVLLYIFISSILFLNSCVKILTFPTIDVSPTQIAITTETLIRTQTRTTMHSSTPSPTLFLTSTMTPTNTATTTPTSNATMTLTLTSEFPVVVVNVQAAHCRYGPSKSFLHAADLYEGDRGVIQGRFQYSDWFYIKWDKLAYRCWVSPYVVEVTGEIAHIGNCNIGLERIPSTLYNPPQNVNAYREGDIVSITWDRVAMTEDDDRGYLIEAFICQDGAYFWWTARIESQFTTSYTVRDDASCPLPSSGQIYTVEKHGYTAPVMIPWPP